MVEDRQTEDRSEREFDDIISLGFKCETAYSIEAIFGKADSNLFNWVAIKKIDDLIRFLQNPDLLMSKGIEFSRKTWMYDDNELAFGYHTKADFSWFKNASEAECAAAIEEDKKELYSRFSYLRNKFWNKVRSNHKNLFVMCFDSRIEKERVNSLLKTLSELVYRSSGNKNSKILVIFEKAYIKDVTLDTFDNVLIESIKTFSEPIFAHGICIADWKRIYSCYRINYYDYPIDFNHNIQNFIVHRKLKYWRLKKLKKSLLEFVLSKQKIYEGDVKKYKVYRIFGIPVLKLRYKIN